MWGSLHIVITQLLPPTVFQKKFRFLKPLKNPDQSLWCKAHDGNQYALGRIEPTGHQVRAVFVYFNVAGATDLMDLIGRPLGPETHSVPQINTYRDPKANREDLYFRR